MKNETGSLLDINGLGKRYGSTIALENISLHIERPAAIGLVGNNGAGKSTLLSLLSGALRPNTGTISILGESPQSIATTGKLNILPQDATFKSGVPVVRQLKLFARLQGMAGPQAADAVNRLLSELGDASFAHRVPGRLSYGQRKRLGIVQAFLGNPELVVLDEPTAGLDPVAANDVRGLIGRLSGNSSFIISSHNLYEIEDICSSVIILDKGRLLAFKPIAELARTAGMLKLVLDRGPEEELLQDLQGLPNLVAIQQDRLHPEKLTLQLGGEDVDELQLQIQRLILDHGYTIVEFSRSRGLINSIMDLVGKR